MTDSLGTLLSSSYSMYKAKFIPILIAAIVFGLLTYGAQLYFQTETMNTVQQHPFGNMERFEELSRRAGSGDEAAIKELMEQAGVANMEDMPSNDEMMQQMAGTMMQSMLPTMGAFLVLSIIISFVSSAYYLLLAVDPTSTGESALRKTPQYILPIIGLWIWTFLRSFAWIPFIGFIFAIALGPRFIMAPVLLLREDIGVFESARQSLRRSRGYWAKIVGNLLAAGLLMWVLLMVVSVPMSMLLPTSTAILALTVIVSYLAMAFGMVFMVKLANTILANPKTA